MGKKCFVMALAVFAFGFGTALRSNAGTDMIEPYRAPAPQLQLRAATTAAPCGLSFRQFASASSLARLWLLWAGYGYYGRGLRLRRPPVITAASLLAAVHRHRWH